MTTIKTETIKHQARTYRFTDRNFMKHLYPELYKIAYAMRRSEEI